MVPTKKQILVIADELSNSGQKPTLALIRKRLGGGSFKPITQAMAEWKARKAAKDGLSPHEPVIGWIGEMATAIWDLSLETAELADKLTAELEFFQERIAAQEKAEKEAEKEALLDYALDKLAVIGSC